VASISIPLTEQPLVVFEFRKQLARPVDARLARKLARVR
jgi:hypothetical protein